MDLIICEDRYCLGRQAAAYTARCLRDAVAQKGGARLVISAGESQLETYVALMRLEEVPWEHVELFFLDSWDHIKFFHLDRKLGWTGELIPDVPDYSGGSYRKYIKENVKAAHFMEAETESAEETSKLLEGCPVDVALLGMGQKAHPVFYCSNDAGGEMCQEVVLTEDDREALKAAWFENTCDLPKQLLSLSVQALKGCRNLILCAPGGSVSEEALDTTKNNLEGHSSLTLFVEKSILSEEESL